MIKIAASVWNIEASCPNIKECHISFYYIVVVIKVTQQLLKHNNLNQRGDNKPKQFSNKNIKQFSNDT